MASRRCILGCSVSGLRDLGCVRMTMVIEPEQEAPGWTLADLLIERSVPEGTVVQAELTDGRWVAVKHQYGIALWAPGDDYKRAESWRTSEYPVYTGTVAKMTGEAWN